MVDTSGFLPLDLVQQISDIVANNHDLRTTVQRENVRDIKSCTLVSRVFAAAFQPHLFQRTSVSGAIEGESKRTEGMVQKRLRILTSSPHLGSYVRFLTVTMKDGRNDHDVPALLNRLTAVKSLSLASISFRGRAPWSWFTPSFRAAIARLCGLPTLETLNLNKLEAVPASLFLSNRSLTSVSLAGSLPIFDFSSPHVVPFTESTFPLSLNVSDVDLTKFDLQNIVGPAKGFFQRVQTLKGSTTWEGERSAAFSTLVTLLAGISSLEHLSMALSTEYGIRSPTVPPPNLLGSLARIRGLKVLTLTARDAGRNYPLLYFVSALPRVICALDTTYLERFSLHILGVKYQDLPTLCGSQCLGSKSADSLDMVLASRREQGKLEALQEVRITIQIDRTEFNMKLEEAKRLVREAGFLASLPLEMVRIVLKDKVGNVMYDSR